MQWHDLAATSHYQTAGAIKHALEEGNADEAMLGLEEMATTTALTELSWDEVFEDDFTPSERSLTALLPR